MIKRRNVAIENAHSGSFFLKIQAKMLLPARTLQCIIDGFQHVHSSNMLDFYEKLKCKLSRLNIPPTERESIIHELSNEDR